MTATIDTSPEALLAVSDDSRCDIDPQDIDGDTPHHLQWCHDVVVLLRALAAEKSAWATREAGLEHQLRNLLAIIFRDGGQRAAAYPTLAEAVEAAHLEWAELVRERDEALAETAETTRLTCMHLDNMTIATKHAEARAEQANADAAALRDALQALHDNDLEYIRINNLTGAENNQVLQQARKALSSTAGRDLLARMERLRSALVKLHHVVTCHVIEYTNARALRDAVAGAKAALADQQGEKT